MVNKSSFDLSKMVTFLKVGFALKLPLPSLSIFHTSYIPIHVGVKYMGFFVKIRKIRHQSTTSKTDHALHLTAKLQRTSPNTLDESNAAALKFLSW